jgi:hypothetical protein
MTALPDNFNHVMIDIETLGMKPGCVVLQIACVPFQLRCQEATIPADKDRWLAYTVRATANFHLNVSQQLLTGMKIDGETLKWWAHPERTNIYPALFMAGAKADNRSVLADFCDYIKPRETPYIWTRGIDFDLPIISELLRVYDLREPWHYRHKMDVRTYLAAAFGTEMPNRDYYLGTAHDAAVDCLNQIQDVQKAWRKLNHD